jgi:hypothetical protein
MLSVLLTTLIAATPPKVYVSGYGWINGRTVGHCLLSVGAPHVDTLHDAQWEEFVDCVVHNGG